MAQNQTIKVLVYGIGVADNLGNYYFIGTPQNKDIPVAGAEFLEVNTPKQFPGLINIIYGKVIYWPGGNPTAPKEAYVMDTVAQLHTKANA